MKNCQSGSYYKGYVAGYRDGITAAANGTAAGLQNNDISGLPVKAMEISSRARNCLSQAGCVSIADIAALSDTAIATMRRLGVKSACEIANWLDAHGICYSAWNKYL